MHIPARRVRLFYTSVSIQPRYLRHHSKSIYRAVSLRQRIANTTGGASHSSDTAYLDWSIMDMFARHRDRSALRAVDYFVGILDARIRNVACVTSTHPRPSRERSALLRG